MQINPWFNSVLGLTLSLGIGLNTPLIAPVNAQNQTDNFADVSADYWAHDYIEALVALDILNGFPDGAFRPYEPLTRAQFAAILQQAFLDSETFTTASFNDVPSNYWATEAISAVYAADFLVGYPDNNFRPEQPISRVEVLVALTNGLDYAGGGSDALSYYDDANAIPDYARPHVAAATEANLVVNYPVLARLNPNRNATRAEVAAFIYQALVQEGNADALADTPHVVTETAAAWQPEPIATLPLSAEQMGFSSSGQELITLTSDRDKLQVWSTQTGELLTEIMADEETRFEAIAISASGTQVAAIVQTLTANALELRLWNLETGKQLWRQPLGTVQSQFRPEEASFLDAPTQIAFLPSDEGVLTQISLGFGPDDDPAGIQLSIHDTSTGEVLQTLETAPEAPPVKQFEFSSDGELVAGISYTPSGLDSRSDQLIDIWQLSNGALLHHIRPDEDDFSFMDMVFTPDGALKVFAQYFYDIRLDTWNMRSGERMARITTLPDIDRTDGISRLSPDGEYYFVRSDVAGTRLINTQTRVVTYLNVYVDRAAIFNATGNYLAVTSRDEVQIFSQVDQ
ncbi:MAG: S-layer homology domain-containing protein [Cyanobacteria bacterium J06659_2]